MSIWKRTLGVLLSAGMLAGAMAFTASAEEVKNAVSNPSFEEDITTGTSSLEDAINANTKALEKTNSALADMIRQAGALVLSDNMRLGSTVAASGTAQVVSAANSYHREGDTNITQNFYNGHDTAAAQQREARWEADKAKARKR